MTVTTTKSQARDAFRALWPFLGCSQLSAISEGCNGEERQFFFDRLTEIAYIVKGMPTSYKTDGQGDKAIVQLHYFTAGCDWYIIEKDSEPEQYQAFGFANLGDDDCAELGYISLVEILRAGAELDLHWTPKPLSEVKAR